MNPLRNRTPSRRNNPISVSKHGDHKSSLKEDFKERCGYCDAHYSWKETYFEVDHFIPMDFCKITGNISSTDYFNLVYSCRRCNNAKRAKWPSKSETKFHIKGEGFIDPCDPKYDSQFYRCNKGRIYPNPKSEVGVWMHQTFKFSIRERSIEMIWQLDRLDRTIQELIEKQQKFAHNSNEWQAIEEALNKSCRVYYDFEKQLRDFRSK